MAVSCLECQRRKQKCNGDFPCTHCSKRGVAHLCNYPAGRSSPKTKTSSAGADTASSKKRALTVSYDDPPLGAESLDVEDQAFDASEALSTLGYPRFTHHLVLCRGNGPVENPDDAQGEASEALRNALQFVPAKPYTDCLVDNWLSGANYHYFALFPSRFRTQYEEWWATDSLSSELTSLILRVCACSLLFFEDGGVKKRLELDLKADTMTLANRMHEAARDLSNSIPHGMGGLIHVQQLFLTASWLKSTERWNEAWHALSGAIRAAYEIGLHQDSSSQNISEFDREMRRRIWCLLYSWDCALSSMLSRPMLINQADCTFELPTLALDANPGQPYKPSPFRHMKLHCQMCVAISRAVTSVPAGSKATDLPSRLQVVVEQWLDKLPPEYATDNPDTQWDSEHDWVVFQRRYLHLVGHLFLFGSLKPYVTRSSAKPMTAIETKLREAGVRAALALTDVSWLIFENVASASAKFHYAVFCIFDTSTALCSALVHDEARNLPQREQVFAAVKRGLEMLQELRSVSKTTSDLCRILAGLMANLPLAANEKTLAGTTERKKAKRIADVVEETQGSGTRGTIFSHPGEVPPAANDSSIDEAAQVGAVPDYHPLQRVEGAPGLMGSVAPLHDLGCFSTLPTHFGSAETQQERWQPSVHADSETYAPQGGHVGGSEGEAGMLRVLQYWNWQDLQLGYNPLCWTDTPAVLDPVPCPPSSPPVPRDGSLP